MTLPLDTNLDAQSVSKVINLPAPTSAGDAVPKSYADAISAGVIYKIAVVAASTGSNVTLSSPGATLDGVTLSSGNRILLKDQTTTSQNGVWVWNGSSSALSRPTDYAAASVAQLGDSVYVDQGTANSGAVITLVGPTSGTITVDTTGTTWSQSNLGVISAGTGLSKSGSTISLSVPVSVANGGTNATSAAAARASLSATGKFSQLIGDGSTTTFTVTHNLGTAAVQVQVFDVASGNLELVGVLISSTNAVSVGPFATAPAASGGSVPGGTGKQVVVVG
jgi:hypothetical protein